jgi:hypothetical protein
MSEEIEKLIKVQGILNKRKFHLCIRTDLEQKAEWYLYQVFADVDHYLSPENSSIMESGKDSIDDLIKYLENHNGFERRF